jgi:hypothetical protein
MSLRHPAVGGQERLGSRAHLCDEPVHRAPNWKFCKFKHGEPSATLVRQSRQLGIALPAVPAHGA